MSRYYQIKPLSATIIVFTNLKLGCSGALQIGAKRR